MNNADMPAMPMPMTMMGANSEHVANEPEFGLTKREYFAAMAMQGLTSSPLETEKLSHAANKSLKVFVVEQAVAIADALLEKLEKSVT